jgi:hypothetical protein
LESARSRRVGTASANSLRRQCENREQMERRRKIVACFYIHCESMSFLSDGMNALRGLGERTKIITLCSAEVTSYPVSSSFLCYLPLFFTPT